MNRYQVSDKEMPFKAMIISESKEWISYRLACSCTSPDHDVHIDIELDKECDIVTLTFYKKMQYADWWGIEQNFIRRIWRRISGAWKLIWSGEIELEEEMLLMEERHIDSFIAILNKAKQMWQKVKSE